MTSNAPKYNTNCNSHQEEDESSSDDMGPASPRAYEAATADDEWVEYLDDLGRTRKCLRKDLPYMKAREERMPRRRYAVTALIIKIILCTSNVLHSVHYIDTQKPSQPKPRAERVG